MCSLKHILENPLYQIFFSELKDKTTGRYLILQEVERLPFGWAGNGALWRGSRDDISLRPACRFIAFEVLEELG